jgi:two-component system, NarL family, sensor kinase
MATQYEALRAPSFSALGREQTYLSVVELPAAARQPRSGFVAECTDLRSEGSLREALHQVVSLSGGEVSATVLDQLVAQVDDALVEGLAICDARGEIAYVNPKLCRMLERSRYELIGSAAAVYLGEAHPCSAQARREGDKCASARYEAELATNSGRNIVVEVTKRMLEGPSGEHVGSVCILVDVSASAHALQRSESELRLLSAQFLTAQEIERQRIARELHDGIGQVLGGIKFGLETCAALAQNRSPQATAENIRQLADKMRSVLDEVRRISMDLRPSTLDDLGVVPTIGWFTREFKGIYKELDVETIVDVCEEQIATPVKTAIYRIVQETFNNVATHSMAHKLCLSLKWRNGHIELMVRDDGIGFDPRQYAMPDEAARGLGLASMRERAEMTGGRYQLQSRIGEGTTVKVTWPAVRT